MSIGLTTLVQKLPSSIRNASGSIYSVEGNYPDLVADFDDEYYRANGGKTTLSSLMNHSRSGNATMVDSDGLIKWAPHNLLTYSEQFDNGWNATASSITANDTTAPDGKSTADSLILNSSNSSHYIYKSVGVLQSSVSYTYSVYVKANTRNYAYIKIQGGSTPHYGILVNLTNGAIEETKSNGSFTNTSTNVTAVVGGWYQVSISFTSLPSQIHYIMATPGVVSPPSYNLYGDQVFLGDATAIYVWGSHLYRSDLGGMAPVPAGERSFPSASTYVPTTSSARYLPRVGHHVYNGSAWVNEGVLAESEARTNLVEYSEDLSSGWSITRLSYGSSTTYAGVSFTEIIANSDNNSHYTQRPSEFTSSAGASYTISVFAKPGSKSHLFFFIYANGSNFGGATVNLTNGTVTDDTLQNVSINGGGVQDFGSGYVRAYITVTTTNAATFNVDIGPAAGDGVISYAGDGSTVDISIGGAQLEAAPTPSSYIPTAGSTVTRAAETFTIPAANLPWPTPQVIGDELVTNGTFDTDLTGWSNEAGVFATVVDGVAQITTFTNGQKYYQALSTTIGSVYLVSSVIPPAPASLDIWISDSVGSASIGDFGNSEQFVFVATSTTTYVHIGPAGPAPKTAYIDNISVREINPLSVSIQMDGRHSWSNSGSDNPVPYRWVLDSNNQIDAYFSGAQDQILVFRQEEGGTIDSVLGSDPTYTPGILVPFNIASRHGMTFVNGAVDGVALTENTTPTNLPDLSATDLDLAYDYMGTVERFRVWGVDLGDTGLETATAPSLEPSLSLTFDSSESSFVVDDWSA